MRWKIEGFNSTETFLEETVVLRGTQRVKTLLQGLVCHSLEHGDIIAACTGVTSVLEVQGSPKGYSCGTDPFFTARPL